MPAGRVETYRGGSIVRIDTNQLSRGDARLSQILIRRCVCPRGLSRLRMFGWARFAESIVDTDFCALDGVVVFRLRCILPNALSFASSKSQSRGFSIRLPLTFTGTGIWVVRAWP